MNMNQQLRSLASSAGEDMDDEQIDAVLLFCAGIADFAAGLGDRWTQGAWRTTVPLRLDTDGNTALRLDGTLAEPEDFAGSTCIVGETCMCVRGAAQRYDEQNDTPDCLLELDLDWESEFCLLACCVLTDAVTVRSEAMEHVAAWNDKPGRTFAVIERGMRVCADAFRSAAACHG